MTLHLRILAPLTVLALTLVTGCSADEMVGTSSEGRVVEHSFGETTISSTDRVAVLDGDRTLEAVVALGVQPVASVKPQLTGDYSGPVNELLEEEPVDIGTADSAVNYESLAAAEPDLILMYTEAGEGEDVYEQASEVAPTVVVDYAPARWEDTLREVGAALDRSSEADQLLEEYTVAAEDAAAEIAADGISLSIVRVRADGQRYMTSEGSFPWTVAGDLGFVRPSHQDAGDDAVQTVDVSPEQWELLAGEELLLLVDRGAEEQADKLIEDPRLADVSSVTRIASTEALFGNVLSAHALLDLLASR